MDTQWKENFKTYKFCLFSIKETHYFTTYIHLWGLTLKHYGCVNSLKQSSSFKGCHIINFMCRISPIFKKQHSNKVCPTGTLFSFLNSVRWLANVFVFAWGRRTYLRSCSGEVTSGTRRRNPSAIFIPRHRQSPKHPPPTQIYFIYLLAHGKGVRATFRQKTHFSSGCQLQSAERRNLFR